MDPVATPVAAPSFVRSTAQISAITSVARLAGFARWIVLGLAVGTTYLGNVYQTANLVPNVVFELLAGGMLAAVLVPTFVSEQDKGRERISELSSTIANALLAVSIPLVVIGIGLARPIMGVLLLGVSDPVVRATQIELGAWFLRLFLPQVPLYLLGILMQGILHAHRRFIAPALGPLLSSCTVITTYIVFWVMRPGATLNTVTRAQLWVLGGGTTLGVFVLTFCQLPSVLRLHVRWRPVLAVRDPVVRRALRAGAWGAAFLTVTQAAILVAVALANRVEGGVVAYQIAYAFFELPNALIGLPVAISLYPALSEAFARRDESRFGELLTSGWRLAMFAAVPAGVGLYVLAAPAANALLAWSGHVDAALVAGTIQGLAIGVPAWVMMATIVRALYARGATSRPTMLNALAFATVLIAGAGGTFVTHTTGRAALRLLGTAIGAGWWVAGAVGLVALSRASRVWSLRPALRSLSGSAARGVVVGGSAWLAVRALHGASPIVLLAGGLGAGIAAMAIVSGRSAGLRGTLALLSGRAGVTR